MTRPHHLAGSTGGSRYRVSPAPPLRRSFAGGSRWRWRPYSYGASSHQPLLWRWVFGLQGLCFGLIQIFGPPCSLREDLFRPPHSAISAKLLRRFVRSPYPACMSSCNA